MPDLSVLIPARNELWLGHTIRDVLAHAVADTEVIVVLDGAWPHEPIPTHPKLQVIHHPRAIGQRAACNLAAAISTAPYLMKLDAHCGVAPGFDRVLLDAAATLGDDVTQIPAQYNLHVFDWVCTVCAWRCYQGPTPPACGGCGGTATVRREVLWQKRDSRLTTAWRFDSALHFQYWGEFKHRPEGQPTIHDVLSCLGACWFLSKARYTALGGLDEAHGSWGQMGTELACKSWLSGGRMVVNKGTWFSHMFRTQGGDFSFPYPLSGREVEAARAHSRRLWIDGTWPHAVRPLRWLLEHFAPVPGWDPAALAALPAAPLRAVPRLAAAPPPYGVLTYTDSTLPGTLAIPVVCQLLAATARHDAPIVGVRLGDSFAPLQTVSRWRDIRLDGPRGPLTMFRQILAGLEALAAAAVPVVFFCEHDVLYHPSHFDFRPPRADTFYYNQHVWKVDTTDGKALHYACSQTSGLCVAVPLALAHYRARVARVEAEGFTRRMGFEPGTRSIRHGGITDDRAETWRSPRPNVDLRHGGNLTPSRWTKDQFRDQRYTTGWTEGDGVPGWGTTRGRATAWLGEVHTRALEAPTS